jgi:hypothetical protein
MSFLTLRPASFSPQGLAGGQIMRLTAAAYSPDPCNATLGFVNRVGAPIGSTVIVNLSPGQLQSLDLPSAMLGMGLGNRS